MLVNCNSCAKQYQIDTSRIKGEKAKFTCKKCGNIIVVEKPTNLHHSHESSMASKTTDSQTTNKYFIEMTEKSKEKKKSSTLSMIGTFFLFFIAFILIYITFDRIAFVLRNHELPSVHSSKDYFVEFQIPKSWSVKFSKNKYHWLTAQSANKKQYIKILSFKFDHRISITEFLKYERKIFPKFGNAIESHKINLPWFRKFLDTNYNGIDKIYKIQGNKKVLVRYITSSTYAYAVMAGSSTNNLEPLQKMLNYDLSILNKNVIYADIKNILNNYHEILVWIIGAAIAFTFWITIGFLGKTGWFIRIAHERIKSLYEIKKHADSSNQVLNKKYYKMLFKMRVRICFIASAWIAFYVLAFYLLGKGIIILLLLIIVPVLGYFGLRFGPSDDLNDWVH